MKEFELSNEQKQAIRGRGGATLVSAAAGAGKTFVLVERLLTRITDPREDCDIDRFLVITFTKKAAGELRTRITEQLAERLAENPGDRRLARQLARVNLAPITTIDGFCSELVRRYAFRLDLTPDFRQIEEAEARDLQGRVIRAVLERHYAAPDDDFRHLSETLGAGDDDKALDEAIAKLSHDAQAHADPSAWLRECIEKLAPPEDGELLHTPWGAELQRRFRRVCEAKIQTLRRMIDLCAGKPVLAAYPAVLETDIAIYEACAAEERWAALYDGCKPNFPKKPTVKAADKSPLTERVDKMRKNCKETLKAELAVFGDPAQVAAAQAQTARALRTLLELTIEFEEAFAAEKRRLRVQDFGDIEHGAVRLLVQPDGSPTPLARELSGQYEEIMLDEYQDTNEVQDRIFLALSKDGRNRFMVGDVKQSIYRFRLAEPEIFLEKYRTYKPWEAAQAYEPRKILLSENFRSGPEILEAANAVFSACMSPLVGELRYGEEEALRFGSKDRPRLPDKAVELHCIDTKPKGSAQNAPARADLEADFVARRIRELLKSGAKVTEKKTLRPVQPEDIVILMRYMTAGPVFQQALRRCGIESVCQKSTDLLKAPQIETLVSLLCALDNAHRDVPLTAALLSPLLAVPADVLAQVRAEHKKCDLWDALAASSNEQAAAAYRTLCALREKAAVLELPELLTLLSQRLHLEELSLAAPEGERRLAELRQFFAMATAFSEGGKKSLAQFLSHLELLQSEAGAEPVATQKGAVTIMSIHASKGLEFPVVVLAGLMTEFSKKDYEKQVMSHPQLGAACPVTDPVGLYRFNSPGRAALIARKKTENLSEELRVLYVAMTRARDRLIMTCCKAGMDERLKKLSARLTLPPDPLLATEAACPGDWVLEAALLRTEAGELFIDGEKPEERQVSELPWEIRYHVIQAVPEEAAAEAAEAAQRAPAQALQKALDFHYPDVLTQIPAKLTATQLKGRRKDEEAAAGAPVPAAVKALRRASFDTQRPLSPTERGTATHLAMQYIDFAETGSVAQIEAELQRLVAQEFLTERQADAVSPERLYRIFAGQVGARIRAADRVVREFKFSLLVDASIRDARAAGEKLLLQGVTDCCLIKDGKLTVIDFKTDRVRPGEEPAAAERYRGQLEAYSLALGRIFGLPVEEKLLWFFQTDTEVGL